MSLFDNREGSKWERFDLGPRKEFELKNFRRCTELPKELVEQVKFTYPGVDWSNRDHLRLLFPSGNSKDLQGRVIIESAIQKYLQQACVTPHPLSRLVDLALVANGTTVLASAGVVRHPLELIDYAAKRYATMVLIEIDREIINRLVSAPALYRFKGGTVELSPRFAAAPGTEATVTIGGSLAAAISNRTFWGRRKGISEAQLMTVMVDAAQALSVIEGEAKQGFSEMLELYRELVDGRDSDSSTQ